MNLSSQKLIAALLTGLILVALAASPGPVQSQNPTPADITSEPIKAKIDRSLIQINKRPPIQCKEFQLLDPSTGKAFPPGTILHLRTGKTIRADEYGALLKELNQKLCKSGQTLNDPTPIQITTVVPRTSLQKQAQALRAATLPNSMFRPLDLRSVEQDQFRMIATPTHIRPDIVLNYPVVPLHWNKDWSYALGDSSTFSTFIKGNIGLNGSRDLITIDGEVNAGCAMFSNSFGLLRVTTDLNAPRSGTMNARVDVTLAGVTVYNLNQNTTTSWSKTDSLQRTLDKSLSIPFPGGPIPASLKLGIHGSAGVSYGVAVAPIRASAHVAPFVHTNAYAQFGLDLGIFGAGVEGNLTILNTEGNLAGDVSIDSDNTGLYYKWNDSYCQSLDMLSGKLSAYVFVDYLIGEHKWNWDIFAWTGFRTNGCAFNDSKTLYLDARLNTTNKQ
ncbi:MAG: hypothetical protein JWM21_844 [Acidobacteria bacterium]|nr:hypothetical protein [Acidobacteriota bacterium]